MEAMTSSHTATVSLPTDEQILIEREKSNVLNFKDVTEVDAAKDDYYQTQYRLLQSRSLARRVIESLNLLQDPEFGGPRAPQEVQAAFAAPPGSSPVKPLGVHRAFLLPSWIPLE